MMAYYIQKYILFNLCNSVNNIFPFKIFKIFFSFSINFINCDYKNFINLFYIKSLYYYNIISRSSDWISMNFFLCCSPHCTLQNIKKIIEIGLVNHEIIAEYDVFRLYTTSGSVYIVFSNYLTIYQFNFNYL